MERIRKEGNGKLRSISNGINLGIQQNMIYDDCQKLNCSNFAIEENDQFMILPKDKVLKTIEQQLTSPPQLSKKITSIKASTRNHNNIYPATIQDLSGVKEYDQSKTNRYIQGGGKRSLSPTLAETTSNPPYGWYPNNPSNTVASLNRGCLPYQHKLVRKVYHTA
mmetsp:Transcript_38881/g.37218  ORF Transcript_38881/g.37218 Transcript_38881/m.37218 type:complete len:165 (-) Transcript_38881:629-1123(-)